MSSAPPTIATSRRSTASPFGLTSNPRRQKAGSEHRPARPLRGLTTRIRLVVDAQGLSIPLGLVARQAHDSPIASELIDRLGPRTIVLADQAFGANRIREISQDRVATPYIPLKTNRK